MGSLYNFTCAACGYEATVSGALDYGMLAVVRTMTCKDCTVLVDVLVGARGKEGKTGDPDYDKDMGHCPQCDGTDVSKWPPSHPCPKCGSRMRKGDSVADWD